MSRRFIFVAAFLAFTRVSPAPAQETLPLVENVAYKAFRGDCLRALDGLRALKAGLPEETQKAIRKLLEKEPRKPADVVARVQKLLDVHCLIGITINPESRVKAARGPAPAELAFNRPALVLVKVHNEAGVTHALKVSGPQFRAAAKGDKGRWLEAEVVTSKPFRKTLSGQAVEYVALRLVAHEAGKREVTFQFDVGQGTQDLGFRAEVPVLFKIRKGKTENGRGPRR
jgi:hypothetical protein